SGEWPRNWINAYLELPENSKAPSLATVPDGAKNPSAAVIKTFNDRTWTELKHDPEFKVMTFKLPNVRASQYVRLRGTNLPANVPFETDANGNPLPDIWTNAGAVNPTVPGGSDGIQGSAFLRIPCNAVGTTEFNGCPSHTTDKDTGKKFVSFDVAAWADLWFYSNPIYIEVK